MLLLYSFTRHVRLPSNVRVLLYSPTLAWTYVALFIEGTSAVITGKKLVGDENHLCLRISPCTRFQIFSFLLNLIHITIAPSAPASAQVNVGGSDSVKIAFSAPLDDGGSPVTSYMVRIS